MPSKKAIIITVIFSLIIAGIIFKVTEQGSGTPLSPTSIAQKLKPTPSPTPRPTLPPITGSSNLTEEIGKLTIPDHSSDFQNLKSELSNF